MFHADKGCFSYYFININIASILGGEPQYLAQISCPPGSVSSQVMSHDTIVLCQGASQESEPKMRAACYLTQADPQPTLPFGLRPP